MVMLVYQRVILDSPEIRKETLLDDCFLMVKDSQSIKGPPSFEVKVLGMNVVNASALRLDDSAPGCNPKYGTNKPKCMAGHFSAVYHPRRRFPPMIDCNIL